MRTRESAGAGSPRSAWTAFSTAMRPISSGNCATDAAISPDGAKLAVMTVTGPYLFQVDGDVAAAGRVPPVHQLYFDLKDMNMEGVCFVEGGLLATTEQGQVLFFKDADFK